MKFIIIFLSITICSAHHSSVSLKQHFWKQNVASRKRFVREIPVNDTSQYNSGLSTLHQHYGVFLYGIIEIGQPSQAMCVVFDLVTDLTWIVSTQCHTPQCSNRRRYDPTKSTTFMSTTELWHSGKYASGRLAIDAINFSNYTHPTQVLGLADEIFEGFTDLPFDGFFSLAMPNPGQPLTPLENVMRFSDEKVFTIWVSQGYMENNEGLISFGHLGSSHCHHDWRFIQIFQNASRNHFWSLPLFEVTFGSNNFKMNGSAHLDSVSLFLLVPKGQLIAIVGEIKAVYDDLLKVYVVDCGKKSTLPNLEFKFSEQNETYSIKPESYVIDAKENEGRCILAINDHSLGEDVWILGNAFLQSYCTSYDLERLRVGLATPVITSENSSAQQLCPYFLCTLIANILIVIRELRYFPTNLFVNLLD
ncbi:eukaryotic aspartyl protease domain-containing protein [Ditylenchus destructor]|uniref:Eukaryotic aspartyl protease domain-containing protein n=1 Tax=Ditylenchus destructor TaxID=166010 RepID=A0AAD4NGU4_9BILA|nr:eukaryotic aspartyl protease domain-containing protein [Ditylenchus destructor]